MATKVMTIVPLLNQSGNNFAVDKASGKRFEVFEEITTYEFCPELWDLIKSYYLIDDVTYQKIMDYRLIFLSINLRSASKFSRWYSNYSTRTSSQFNKKGLNLIDVYADTKYVDNCRKVVRDVVSFTNNHIYKIATNPSYDNACLLGYDFEYLQLTKQRKQAGGLIAKFDYFSNSSKSFLNEVYVVYLCSKVDRVLSDL